MSQIDLIKQALAAIEAGDLDKVAAMATEGMQFDGPVPDPVGKKEFIALQKSLVFAIPDWRFNARDFKEIGHDVLTTVQISGTHTRALSLPMLSNPLPPTGKRIQLPAEHLAFTFDGNKIHRIHSNVVPGGGVMGILDQIGLKAPVH